MHINSQLDFQHSHSLVQSQNNHLWCWLLGNKVQSDLKEAHGLSGEGNGNPLQYSCLENQSHGQRSLVGCCPQGRTELDTTEVTQHACMHWRRKWQPTPVVLPGVSQGQRSLVGCCLWGCTESNTTKATQQQQQQQPLLGLLDGSAVTNLPTIQERQVHSWLGKIPWRRNYQPLQYSCLESPMDRGTWWTTVHGVAKKLATQRLNTNNKALSCGFNSQNHPVAVCVCSAVFSCPIQREWGPVVGDLSLPVR